MERRRRVLRKSAFGSDPKEPDSLGFLPSGLGQPYPQHCLPPEPMGMPLTIGEAARLIGCSPWTIRQTLMPRGLPHFRFGGGKLIFYQNQIIRWIEAQQKGGM
jgi:excisionase family DNA binding protein